MLQLQLLIILSSHTTLTCQHHCTSWMVWATPALHGICWLGMFLVGSTVREGSGAGVKEEWQSIRKQKNIPRRYIVASYNTRDSRPFSLYTGQLVRMHYQRMHCRSTVPHTPSRLSWGKCILFEFILLYMPGFAALCYPRRFRIRVPSTRQHVACNC